MRCAVVMSLLLAVLASAAPMDPNPEMSSHASMRFASVHSDRITDPHEVARRLQAALSSQSQPEDIPVATPVPSASASVSEFIPASSEYGISGSADSAVAPDQVIPQGLASMVSVSSQETPESKYMQQQRNSGAAQQFQARDHANSQSDLAVTSYSSSEGVVPIRSSSDSVASGPLRRVPTVKKLRLRALRYSANPETNPDAIPAPPPPPAVFPSGPDGSPTMRLKESRTSAEEAASELPVPSSPSSAPAAIQSPVPPSPNGSESDNNVSEDLELLHSLGYQEIKLHDKPTNFRRN